MQVFNNLAEESQVAKAHVRDVVKCRPQDGTNMFIVQGSLRDKTVMEEELPALRVPVPVTKRSFSESFDWKG